MQQDSDFARCGKVGSGERSTVRVMVRVRPFVARELRGLDPNEYPISVVNMVDTPSSKQVFVDGKDPFEYDETFWSIPESQKQFQCMKQFADQESIFNVIGMPAVDHAIKGFHSCIFAYGQTGSGKTHTMLGSIDDPGVAPRVVDQLFERLEQMAQDKREIKKGFSHEIEISFMEIYNERVKDLFDSAQPSPRRKASRMNLSFGQQAEGSSFPRGGSMAEYPRGSSMRHMSPRRSGSPRSSKSFRGSQQRGSGKTGGEGTPTLGPAQAPVTNSSLSMGLHQPLPVANTPSDRQLTAPGSRHSSELVGNDSGFGEHMGKSLAVPPSALPESPSRSAMRRRPPSIAHIGTGRDDSGAGRRTPSPRSSPVGARGSPAHSWERQGSNIVGAEEDAGRATDSPSRKVQWTQPQSADGEDAHGGSGHADFPRKKSMRISTGASMRRKSAASMGSMRRISLANQTNAPTAEDETYRDLKVRQSPQQGTFVEGLTRLGKKEGVRTAEDVKSRMRYGMEHRATAATQMNDTSSRSHAIFQICVKSNNAVACVQRYSHVNLVDLAGSERIKMSGAEGQRFHEATRINLSLSTLRRVIDILLIENSAKKKKEPQAVIPYRESMLTWILSDSLGGNSKTSMVATVSPAVSNKEDSINTLEYASKAKKIVNTVFVNEQKTSVMMGAMMQEIKALRDRMQEAGDDSLLVDELKEEIERRERELEQVQADAQRMEREQQQHREEIQAKQALLEEHEQDLQEMRAADAEKREEHEELQKQKQRAEQELEEKLRRIKQAEQRRTEAEQEHRLEISKIAQRREVAEKVQSRHQAYKQEAQDLQAAAVTRRFQLDFKSTKTSNARIRLETEVATLQHRIARVRGEITVADEREAALRAKCAKLTSAAEGEERRAERVEAECAQKEAAIAQQLKQLLQARQQAEDEVAASRAEEKRLKSGHHLAQELRLREAHASQERGIQWRKRVDAVRNEKDKKRRLQEQLRRQAAALRDEIAALRGEVEGMTDARDRMAAAAARARRGAALLRSEAPGLVLQEQLKARLLTDEQLKARRLAEVHGILRERYAHIAGVHGPMKVAVTDRFFPAAHVPPEAEEGDGVAGSPRSSRPGSRCASPGRGSSPRASSATQRRPASLSPPRRSPRSPHTPRSPPGRAHTQPHPPPVQLRQPSTATTATEWH